MRVLVLFSSSELGGAERSLSRMVFASQGIDYTLATLQDEGPWSAWVREEGHEPVVLGRTGLSHSHLSIGAFWRLVLYVRSHPVDVIYVCGARAALAIRFLRLVMPAVKIVHGIRWNPDSDTRLDRFLRTMERLTHRRVDAWIANSQVAKDTLVRRCNIPADRVFVIYNGLETLPSLGAPVEARFPEVLTVANLNPRKGHREFLTTIRQVVDAIPDARFVFVGRDDMNGAVQRAIETAGLGDIVRYDGFKSVVAPWFDRARVFVLPSLWGEGCPTSILEAFSYSVPVVAFAIDGIPELVSHEKDGILVQNADWAALGAAIIRLLGDPGGAQEMGQRGRKKVADQFMLERCASEHRERFQSLLRIR